MSEQDPGWFYIGNGRLQYKDVEGWTDQFQDLDGPKRAAEIEPAESPDVPATVSGKAPRKGKAARAAKKAARAEPAVSEEPAVSDDQAVSPVKAARGQGADKLGAFIKACAATANRMVIGLWRLVVAGCRLIVAGCRFIAAGLYRLAVAGWHLIVAGCRAASAKASRRADAKPLRQPPRHRGTASKSSVGRSQLRQVSAGRQVRVPADHEGAGDDVR